ncbi:hypothetical protein SBOR_6637 [Sclerotinia borealis F-4128]|uniref:ASX DEUBAD domain-containing protein n=1 Tax=Sclerotinia borealis (strain F-4128) TaxID=1432307 RepID=W9CAU9_SCLBF|nr:hypothetical protein SBOR_6637 [Sclerotinia borealis F-4128]
MDVNSAPSAPVTVAPPSSGAADSGFDTQIATAATPISISEASSTAYNEAIGVLDSITAYHTAARPEMNLSLTREINQLPVERPLSGHFMISSCSDRAYIPTPFNTPRTVTVRESHLPKASSSRGNEKPALKKVATRLPGDGSSEKPYLRGGGPKKRLGGAAGGARKKPKPDKYADIDQLLSDFKSPIFQANANIKAVITHPLAKQTMVEQGEPYPFDHMTGDEIATTAADFKIDGTYGRFEPDWISQALVASETRASGGYDDYLAAQFAKHWAEDEEELSDEEMKDIDDAKNDKEKEKK